MSRAGATGASNEGPGDWPALFIQTPEGGWKAVLESGEIGLPYSKRARACYVEYRDVAEVAARALTEDTLSYGTFELCAPGMIDRQELAAIVSEALGRTITAAEPPFEEWARRAGIPEGPVKNGLKRMFANYDSYGFPGGNALVLRAILGREPRSLRQYIQELASHPPGLGLTRGFPCPSAVRAPAANGSQPMRGGDR